MTVRLWDSTCQSAYQRPTSSSDMMWLRSQRTTQATDIISNQGIFQEAHVTLCPKPHTDMISWIPRIPRAWKRQPAADECEHISEHTGLNISPCASSGGAWITLREIYRLTSTPVTSCPHDGAGPLREPLPAAQFHFSKQHSWHIGDNSSPIMGVITKQLSVSRCQARTHRALKNTLSDTDPTIGIGYSISDLKGILKFTCNKRSVYLSLSHCVINWGEWSFTVRPFNRQRTSKERGHSIELLEM